MPRFWLHDVHLNFFFCCSLGQNDVWRQLACLSATDVIPRPSQSFSWTACSSFSFFSFNCCCRSSSAFHAAALAFTLSSSASLRTRISSRILAFSSSCRARLSAYRRSNSSSSGVENPEPNENVKPPKGNPLNGPRLEERLLKISSKIA